MSDRLDTSALLLSRLRHGDDAAAQTLFDRYLIRLTSLARARLSQRFSSRLDPEDIVLSAYCSFFVAARDGRFSVDPEAGLWPLLVTITLRKLYRQIDRQTAEVRSVDREESPSSNQFALASVASREPTPDEVIAVTDEIDTLLRSQSPETRRILELRLQGEGIQAIAVDIGRSERTVRRTIAKIRTSLASKHEIETQPIVRDEVAGTDHIEVPEQQHAPAVKTSIEYSDLVIERLIGSGGMEKVYRARWKSDSTRVAVKFLRKRFLQHELAVRMFLQEARIVAELNHPGLVQVHGLGQTPYGALFIVMDFVQGGDLGSQIQNGAISPHQSVQWVTEACDAMSHAHERGLIHCDLKPANLLLDCVSRIRLTDFGLARSIEGESPTVPQLAGTAAFMAPEQIADCWGNVGPTTDVYGLGAVLYNLLTGHAPYEGSRAPDVLSQVVSSRRPQPVTEQIPTIPSELSRICDRCLEKSPANRYQSTADLRAALVDVLDRLASEQAN
jgi:RNA polymerase sigma factor (sigma-70 family)